VVALALAIYKPAGRIGADFPRWAKVFAMVMAVALLAVGAMMIFGRHGPGAH
jgi:hypothetical protein